MSFQVLITRFEILVSHLVASEKGNTQFIDMINDRIQGELHFTEALRKVGNNSCLSGLNSSLGEALSSYKSDALNNALVKENFIESLRIDVLAPVIEMQKNYAKVNGLCIPMGRTLVAQLNNSQAAFQKSKQKLETCRKSSSEVREKLVEAKLANVPMHVLANITGIANDAMSEESKWDQKVQTDFSTLQKQLTNFMSSMNSILVELQKADEKRIEVLKAALQRQLVVEISFLSNRNYDTKSMHTVYEEVSPAKDLHSFVQSCLVKPEDVELEMTMINSTPSSGTSSNPPDSFRPDSIRPPDSYRPAFSFSDALNPTKKHINMAPPVSAPYSKHRKAKTTHQAPETKTNDFFSDFMGGMDHSIVKGNPLRNFNPSEVEEDVEDMEELYLGDLIGRLSVHHDLSSIEMKKLNSTLASLKSNAPMALLRVLSHYSTPESQLIIAERTFDFFSQLLRNMLKKFMQLKDYSAALLTCYICTNVLKFSNDIQCTVHDCLENNSDLVNFGIDEWKKNYFENSKGSPEETLGNTLSIYVEVYHIDLIQGINALIYLCRKHPDVMDEDKLQKWAENANSSFKIDLK